MLSSGGLNGINITCNPSRGIKINAARKVRLIFKGAGCDELGCIIFTIILKTLKRNTKRN